MAVYYVWSAAAGSGTGADWVNAFTTLTAAFTTEVAGDTLYVAQDHAETSGSAVTLTSSGTVTNWTKVICVDRAGTVPPVSADRRTTAQVSTTGGTSAIILNGFTHYDGIIFNNSNTGVSAGFTLPGTSGNALRFDNCSFRFTGSSGTSSFNIGSLGSVTGSHVEWNNTTLSFGAVGQAVNVTSVLRWRNTASALLGAAVPNTLFSGVGGRGTELELIGVDLSAAGSGKTLVNTNISATFAGIRFIDCKLDAAVTKHGSFSSHGAAEVDFIRTGATGVNYTIYRGRNSGTLDHETTIIRSGGASDGVTPLSWKVTTTANCNYSMPFPCPDIAIWNDTTGSAVTATVECRGAAVPNDDEVWLDVEYLGDASSPLASFVNDGKADLIASAAAQTSSSETWGGSTASFKLSCNFTPQQKGWVYCRVRVGKSSTTVYVDPLVVLS